MRKWLAWAVLLGLVVGALYTLYAIEMIDRMGR